MIVDPTFLDHWKTVRLRRILKDPSAAELVLRLWGYCQLAKKTAFDFSPDTLADICHYAGEPAELVKALSDCRFIEVEAGTITVHGWEEYNSRMAASWENGFHGGRPKKNPRITQAERRVSSGEPEDNPRDTTNERTNQPTNEPTNEPPSPPTPKGELTDEEKEAKRIEAEKKAEENEAKRRFSDRICTIMHRRAGTKWSDKERKALNKIFPAPEEDIAAIEAYYSATITTQDYRRKDVGTLLNNWSGEVDRAKKFLERYGRNNPGGANDGWGA